MQGIEKDGLDEALGAKLRGYSERPSDGLFERIERTLAETDAEAARGFVVPAEESPRLSGRTVAPYRRRLLYAVWAAGAAAVVGLALMLTFSLSRSGPADGVLQGTAFVPGGVSDGKEKAGILEAAGNPQIPQMKDTRISDMLEGIFGRTELKESPYAGTAAALPSSGILRRNEFSEPLAVMCGSVSGNVAALRTKKFPVGGSDVSESEGAAFERLWNAVMAEEKREGRLRRRPSASLYAGNLGGDRSDEVSGYKAASSGGSMVIHENSLLVLNPMVVQHAAGSGTPPAEPAGEPTLKHKFPLSVGVAFDFPLTRRISLQTGLNYSYMRSVSENYQTFGYRNIQDLHYLGIPVAVVYTPLQTRYFSLYLRGGAMLEKAVYARTKKEYLSPEDGGSGRKSDRMHVGGVQPSVEASVGALLSFSPTVGLYAEPGVAYYFEQSDQPSSYRTEHRASFSLKLGLRFTFR